MQADTSVRMWATPDERRNLSVRPGDLLICEGGDVGRSTIYDGPDGFIFQNSVHRARPIGDADIRYFAYVMRALHDSDWLDVLCNKATIMHLTGEKLGSLQIPMPSPDEQHRIADFLDAETCRIDRLMTLRRRQVALLRERADVALAGLFSQTAGSREYRFRHLMRFSPCYGVLVPRFTDEGVPLIRVSDLGRLDAELDRLPRIETDQAFEYRRTRIAAGDLLITVVGATIGRCDVAPPEVEGFNVSRAIARVQLIAGLSPWLMAAWVRGRQFRIQAALATSGAAAQPALNMSDMAHFTVWLPESTKGRGLLAERVRAHEKAVTSLLSAVDAQLASLAERRQALITAAVTGQFDVSTASGRNVTEGVTA
ncbi:restriction endonuclease subunit S [Streptomyces werraensis]|uniref:restriction endonuclease subunit S n=1 Tax=Streptomyces werraensis TaxID=68284 RepID=UPI003417F312